MNSPHSQKNELKLADTLARDRTTLANERTLLAYVRTALMLGISGITLVKVVPKGGLLVWIPGAVLCLLGAFTFIWGLYSYARVKRDLRRLG